MSRIFKICVVSHPKESENVIFVIKPNVINFDTFKNEIFIRMPELMDHTLTFFYQDIDGTIATISNDTDFEAFNGKYINKLLVTKISTTENSEESRHANIMCNGCGKEICGYRYKCLDCSDFNLCVECEPKMHYHHLMIRIDKPSDEPVNDEMSEDGFVRSRHSESRSSGNIFGMKRHHRDHLHEIFQRGHHHDHKIRHFQKKHGHHGKHHLFKNLHRSHGPHHQLQRSHHHFKGPHRHFKEPHHHFEGPHTHLHRPQHHLHRPHHNFKGPLHHAHRVPTAFGHPHPRHSYFSGNDHAESSDTPNITLIDLSDSDDEDTQILIV